MSKVYRFDVPQPSAKRLKANVKFVVRCIGFGCEETVYAIEPSRTEVCWIGPDELDHHEEWALDADYSYLFHFEFSNVTGSRKEKYEVEAVQVELGVLDCSQVLDDASSQKTFYD